MTISITINIGSAVNTSSETCRSKRIIYLTFDGGKYEHEVFSMQLVSHSYNRKEKEHFPNGNEFKSLKFGGNWGS